MSCVVGHPLLSEAFLVLMRGFPVYEDREFDRARRLLSPPTAPDMAGAIVSDIILVLSQLGLPTGRGRGSIAASQELLFSLLAAVQDAETRTAEIMVHRMTGSVGASQLLPLQVLAKRLTLAGIRLRVSPELRVIPGDTCSSRARQARAGRPTHLKLVSSR